MNIEQRILKCVIRTNWILFILLTGGGFLFLTQSFALGIFFGGIIVTVNFHLLARSLKKALIRPELNSHKTALVKFFVRFIISGLIIFVLIAKHVVHPLGLFIGLSLVVLSIFIATICELKTYILKEAT
jgi:hypothetical protein